MCAIGPPLKAGDWRFAVSETSHQAVMAPLL